MPTLTFSMIAAGVRGGATTAYHVTDSKPGNVSAIAGTSGRLVMRWGDATAMSFNLPALTSGNDTPRLSNMQSTLPATRSLSAGAEPRYGTFCSFTCAIIWNISEVSCEVVPLPWVAYVILPGFARAQAMTSLILLAAILSGLTTSAFGTRAMTTIGTNCCGSNSTWE